MFRAEDNCHDCGEPMDKQTQAVAVAIEKTLEHAYAGNCGILNLEEVAVAAIKASGAEHLGELVRALQRMRNENSDPYGIAKEALRGLPPELRGKNE